MLSSTIAVTGVQTTRKGNAWTSIGEMIRGVRLSGEHTTNGVRAPQNEMGESSGPSDWLGASGCLVRVQEIRRTKWRRAWSMVFIPCSATRHTRGWAV